MEHNTQTRTEEGQVQTPLAPVHTEPAHAQKPKKPLSAVLKWALILAIIVVVNIFFASVVQLAYPSPEYTDFCEEKQVRIIPENQEDCEEIGGRWYEDKYIQRTVPGEGVEIPIIEQEQEGYCDTDYMCRGEYDDARELYERNVFMAWVAFGIILILVSVLVPNLGAIMHGFSLGGVLALIVGSIGYWSDMDEYLRVIVLGIALIVLIVLGIRKFRE